MDRKPHALALILALLLTAPLAAQHDVTQADINRLQAAVTEAGKDIAALRGRDANGARALQHELNDIQDEVIYLKVKLRKERTLPQVEYTDVRDRLENLRTRARGDEGSTGGYARPASGTAIPAGTELDVRLRAPIADRFEATTLVDLKRDGRIVIPAGSVAAGPVGRKGRVTLSFDRITVHGVTHVLRGTLVVSKGKPVELKPGTVLRLRFDSELVLS